MLVASSCASMGADVKEVRAVVNVGPPSSDWILSLQMGRAGRDGQQSVAINLSRAVKVPGEANLPFLALISVLQALQSRTFLLPRGACPSI